MSKTAILSCSLFVSIGMGTFEIGTFTHLVAAEPTSYPRTIQRQTENRDADLIEALIRTSRFEQAIQLCQLGRRRLNDRDDLAALWQIRLSRVESARQMTASNYNDQRVSVAKQPVLSVLTAYPDHRRVLFLRSQLLSVDQDAARHDVVTTLVTPRSEELRQRALRRSTTLTADLDEIIRYVDQSRSLLETSGENISNLGLAADLARLSLQLRARRVQAALLLTELFPSGSRDAIAAAAQAEQVARDALDRLPPDSPARLEIERLRIEAMLRGERLDEADRAMQRLIAAIDGPLAASVRALQIRLDLASGRLSQAAGKLPSAEDDVRTFDEPSIEMDLAKLQVLLADDQRDSGTIAQWIDEIERRHGTYARRRAEAQTLDGLRHSGGSATVDPGIVAVQGRDWLRRGNTARAAELLAAAARAETDPAAAIERSIEAAAAFVAARQDDQAAGLLAQQAAAHPAAKQAAEISLQAALLYAQAELASELEQQLRETIATWPASSSAETARDWLIKILLAQGNQLEAAKVATARPWDQLTEADQQQIEQYWTELFRKADRSGAESMNSLDEQTADQMLFDELANEFRRAFEPELANQQARRTFWSLAVRLLDRDQLSEVKRSLMGLADDSSAVASEPFIEALAVFRQSGGAVEMLATAPGEHRETVTWRLMRDGRLDASRRAAVASLLTRWNPSDNATSQDTVARRQQIERLIWTGQYEEAVSLMRQLLGDGQPAAELIGRVADQLAATASAKAKGKAIELWDELAAGSPQGTPQWHRAKLNAVKLLKQIGQVDAASKRARYILLTSPPSSDELKRQYQAAVTQ